MAEYDVAGYYAKRAANYDHQKERTWQSPSGFQKDLLDRIVKECSATNGTVIDFGVGTGRVAFSIIEQLGRNVVGVDISAEMLGIAKRKAVEKGHQDRLILLEGSMEKLPFIDGTFGCGMAISAFHYLKKENETAKEFKRVLKKGARLIIGDLVVHDKDSLSFFDKLEKAAVPVHNKYHKLAERRLIFEKAGFTHLSDVKFSYKKSFENIIADKAAYFSEEHKKKFEKMVESAPDEIRKIYKIEPESMNLYYGISVFEA